MHYLQSLLPLAATLLMGGHAAGAKAAGNDTRTRIDHQWQFHAGDLAAPPAGPQAAWRTLCLPHDWSIEQAVSQEAPAGNDGGYYPTGVVWYRKTITLPRHDAHRRLWLHFEGAYERSTVYVNGRQVGGHPYGFSPFAVDITDAAGTQPTADVAVRVDNSQQKNCRWYTGTGLYRHVWLEQTAQAGIVPLGLTVTTPTREKAVVRAIVANHSPEQQAITLSARLATLGQADTRITLKAGEERAVELPVTLTDARLWTPADPQLYQATVTTEVEGQPETAFTTTRRFGVRTIAWDARRGLLLNGQPVKLNGTCMHADNGILGAAAHDDADRWRVELMRQAGFNAIRTAHNLPSEAFLDACDEMGMLVIDEAFDGWRDKKNDHDYSTLFDQWWKHDVQAMVRRDASHPSIIAWSIGNEVIERKKIEIVTTAHRLRQAIREIDTTRPVTSALAAWDDDWDIYDPLAAELDITGYNYMIHKAEGDHERVPQRVMWQTESYPRDAFSNWRMMTTHPYIVGDFVWTGLDYLGEAGIGRYWYATDTPGEHWQAPLFPWHGGYCGDVDLTGWRKPISHYRDMLHNGREKLYMAVLEPDGFAGKGKITAGQWAVMPAWERWNWSGWEGRPISVEVCSRYDRVRLYLDDRLIGEQPTGLSEEHKATFTLPYAPGTLRAVGLSGGQEQQAVTLATTGRAVALRLTPTTTTLATGHRLAMVTVEAVDSEGRVVTDAEVDFTISTSGAVTMAGAGSADLQCRTPYNATTQRTWNGRAMVVVASGHRKGSGRLAVKASQMKPATVSFKVR